MEWDFRWKQKERWEVEIGLSFERIIERKDDETPKGGRETWRRGESFWFQGRRHSLVLFFLVLRRERDRGKNAALMSREVKRRSSSSRNLFFFPIFSFSSPSQLSWWDPSSFKHESIIAKRNFHQDEEIEFCPCSEKFSSTTFSIATRREREQKVQETGNWAEKVSPFFPTTSQEFVFLLISF